MATEFRLPDLGENIESGDVVNVLVSEGDEIQPEQNIVEIETDKATVEVPCPHGGRVSKIHVKAGDTVEIGGLLITLDGEAGGKSSAKSESKAAPKKAAPEKKAPEPEPEEEAAAAAAEEAEAPVKPAVTKKSAPPKTPVVQEEEADDEEEEETPPPKAPARKAKPKPEPVAEEEDETTPAPPAKSNNGAPAKVAPVSVPPRGESAEAAAGPATRRLARELGVDINRIKGTGEEGRITREDVVNAVRGTAAPAAPAPQAAAPAPPAKNAPRVPQTPPGVEGEDNYGKTRREKMSRIRKTIAANMSRSATIIPHLTNFDDADITELDEIRKESAADYQGVSIKLTMMPFVLKAVAHALKLHPLLNSAIDEETEEIVYKEYINVGVAVDTPRGLIVPVIRNLDHLSIPQIAHAMAKISDQSKANQFALEDLRGGTFTVSNLGAIGGTYSTPIINHPEVAILLVGRSRKMPVVVNNEVKIRLMMPLSLSYDHRLVDGAAAARFLNEVIALLHAPGRLLLSPLAG